MNKYEQMMHEKKQKEIKKHFDNGYEVERLHSGQKRPYGDSYYEFNITVLNGQPEEDIAKYCLDEVYGAVLPTSQYLKEEREGVADFGDHFRSHWKLTKTGSNKYFYCVTSPSTH